MAVPTTMDVTESSDVGRSKNGALAVNKSSSKIGKGIRRTMAQPRPAPQVYKTEPAEFRSLVQQLTGTSPPAETSAAAPKHSSSRLQKIAPPPLRPTFSYPSVAQPQTVAPPPLPLPTGVQRSDAVSFGGFSPRSSQRVSPFPVFPLSFSPLPPLSPSDQVWLNSLNSLESPGSAAMRQLAQSMAGGDFPGTRQETGPVPSTLQVPLSPRFSSPLSPRFYNPFGLVSPTSVGMPQGFGNPYGFSNNYSPTAALAIDNSFTFPGPEFMSNSGFLKLVTARHIGLH